MAEAAPELPEIPEELGLDPVLCALLHLAYFLDSVEEETLSAEHATPNLERVGLYVQRLDDEQLDELEAQLAELVEYAIAEKWSEDQREWLASFLEHCGIELEAEDASDMN
ncbi:MAG: hypothetical protein KC766_04195 [Myxococcales bacterium]|nr:hypothetical protein [Myxococcales bacterium]